MIIFVIFHWNYQFNCLSFLLDGKFNTVREHICCIYYNIDILLSYLSNFLLFTFLFSLTKDKLSEVRNYISLFISIFPSLLKFLEHSRNSERCLQICILILKIQTEMEHLISVQLNKWSVTECIYVTSMQIQKYNTTNTVKPLVSPASHYPCPQDNHYPNIYQQRLVLCFCTLYYGKIQCALLCLDSFTQHWFVCKIYLCYLVWL